MCVCVFVVCVVCVCARVCVCVCVCVCGVYMYVQYVQRCVNEYYFYILGALVTKVTHKCGPNPLHLSCNQPG